MDLNARIETRGNEVHFQVPRSTLKQIGWKQTDKSVRLGEYGDKQCFIEPLDDATQAVTGNRDV